MVRQRMGALLLLGALLSGSTARADDGQAQAVAVASPAEPARALQTMDEFTGRNALGVMVGLGSGVGVSYRRYLTDAFALRAAGYVFALKDGAQLHDFGLLAQYDFRRDPHFVLYAIGGLSYSHVALPGLLDPPLTLGLFPAAGAGIELGDHEKPGLTYQIELALTALFTNGSFYKLLPLPQVGIHYIF